MVVIIYYYIGYKYKATTWYLTGFPNGSTFSVLVANPKKADLHGGQSFSWSAEQGKYNKKRKSGSSPSHAARSEKIK